MVGLAARALAADDVSFTGRAPEAVVAGERFLIEFSLNAKGSDLRCDIEGKGLDILYGPTQSSSQQISYSGGTRVTSFSTQFTYTVVAPKEGTFTIPGATVRSGSKSYTSNSVTIKVLPADQKSSASQSKRNASTNAASGITKDDPLLRLDLSRTSVYEGEPIVATLKLYYAKNQISNVNEVQLPDFAGFTVQDMDDSNAHAVRERYNDINYWSYPIKRWVIFPSRSGDLKIDAAHLKAMAQVVVRQQMGGIFDIFDFPMAETRNVEVPLSSPERTVKVKPLPSGRPAGFTGGVGDYQLRAEVSTTQVKAGDALVYKLTLSGTGNLKYVRDPEPEFPSDFEVYDPKTDLNVRTVTAGMTGKKVIEYTIVPRFAGTFRIEPIVFSYFDPKRGSYQTISTEAFTIEVERGAEVATTGGGVADFSGANQERLKVLGSDIRYLHPVSSEGLRSDIVPFYGTLRFWLCFLVPLLAFVVLAVVYRRQLRLNADLSRKRTRGASKAAARRLKEASRALRDKDEKAFYEAVHKAMLGYVGDRLNLQQVDLSTDNLRTQLLAHGVSDDIVDRFVRALETCEFARYAPSGDAQAMDQFYSEAANLIDRLEDTVRL